MTHSQYPNPLSKGIFGAESLQDIKIAIKLPDGRIMEVQGIFGASYRMDSINPNNVIHSLNIQFHSYQLYTVEDILRENPQAHAEDHKCPWCQEDISALFSVVKNATNCCHCGGPLNEREEDEKNNQEDGSVQQFGQPEPTKEHRNISAALQEIIRQASQHLVSNKQIASNKLPTGQVTIKKPVYVKEEISKMMPPGATIPDLPNYGSRKTLRFLSPLDPWSPVTPWTVTLPPLVNGLFPAAKNEENEEYLPVVRDEKYTDNKGIPIIRTAKDGKSTFTSYEKD